MNLKELQKHWNQFGKINPMWAIRSDRADWNSEEFFRTGEHEIRSILHLVQQTGFPLSMGSALDFGCGIGRLSQGLCQFFAEVSGVDIAPSMIELARHFNQYGPKCQYFLNAEANLRLFDDNHFDFIYSNIVLQHVEPVYSQTYIREFLRVAKPASMVVFQLPSEQVQYPLDSQGNVSFHAQALPKDCFRATLQVINLPDQLFVSSPSTLTVRVRNDSRIPWYPYGLKDGSNQIKLGNHWMTEEGKIVALDDARALLPRTLPPGEELELPLVITPPTKAGRYILELDMVQELVAWFKNKGSATTHITVDVKARPPMRDVVFSDSSDKAKSSGADFQPVMEMYGIPKGDVVDLIKKSAGSIVDIQQNELAGKEWISYTYFTTKEKT